MNKNSPAKLISKCFTCIFFLLALSSSSWAEDTEIFVDESPPSKPNILFLLDQSASMGRQIEGTTQTRMEALSSAFKTVISDPDLVNVNVGLIEFSRGSPEPHVHGVSFPVSPIDGDAHQIMLSNILPYGSPDEATVGYFSLDDDVLPNPAPGESVRSFLPSLLPGWQPGRSTPIVDSYYEAALYFRGERPKWGLAAPNVHNAAHPSTYKGSSEGTVTQVSTGNTAICDLPDCGINCAGFIENASCAQGELSCGLGTNCVTTTQNWGETCTLSSEAECLAYDPKFTSCTTNTSTNCSTSCINGVYHPETGLCIPDALNSFSIKTHAPNMCLEANGSFLTQQVCDGSPEQVFYTTEARPGFVSIHTSSINSGYDRCFAGALASTPAEASGSEISPLFCSGSSTGNQVFQISGGTIISDDTGNCLDVPESSTASDVEIIQFTCSGGANQNFTLTNEATSCSTISSILCEYPLETASCDHQKYSCDETEAQVSLNNGDIVYNSPITDRCENNAIVMLSDGIPYVRNRDQAHIDQTTVDAKLMTGMADDCAGAANDPGRCGPELARFLATQDQRDDIEGDNIINTYTIGFDVGAGSDAETFLSAVAKAGGGNYFPASDAAALAAVFKAIISDISKTARSFSAPAYTVDPSSRLAHSRNLYIPLFENSATPRWSGNLKKFKLNDAGQIVDRNGKVAVSADGILDPEAADFWSAATTADEQEQDQPNPVTSGGAASQLAPANRKILTDNGTSLVTLGTDSVSKQALSGTGNLADDLQTTLIRFIQGYASDDGASRNHIGDILHSKPTVVTYADKEVIFFGTNEGYLHAINTADASVTGGGKEIFAYMPSALLANIQGQYENEPLTGPIKRIYGVDGEMSLWIQDKNNDGKVSASAGDKAYLYFGLRRGGNAYYALDITNPSSPSLLWTISNKTGGFAKLGQTWSKPAIGKLRYLRSGDVVFEEVLVFGGGYDATVYDEEDPALRTTGNTIGNGVYIVSAKTGDLIWSADRVDGINDSVPGGIRVLDVNRDGSIDRLYFGDTGGNVWRADLNVDDVDDDASLHDVKKDARVYRFANLGDNAGSDNRKFFHEPDVSLFKHGGRLVSMVTIGSGYRAHPNNAKVKDALFVLYDENSMNVPDTVPQPLTVSDLAEPSTLAGNEFLPTHKGWYKSLSAQGEKVLSSPLVFTGKVMFTTFASTNQPVEVGGVGSCSSKTNNFSRAYALDLMTGGAAVDLDGDGVVTEKDEAIIIGHGEIPDSPTLVFNKPSNCSEEGCDHIVDVRVGKMEKPIIDGSTVNGNVDLGEYLPKVFWLNKQ